MGAQGQRSWLSGELLTLWCRGSSCTPAKGQEQGQRQGVAEPADWAQHVLGAPQTLTSTSSPAPPL